MTLTLNTLPEDKLQLLRDTICKGASPQEFELFVHACNRTGLDPFMKQIHAVKRWNAKLGRDEMSIQTGIDGFRLIAERTGMYSPGREPLCAYDKDGKLISATAYIKKQTKDLTWHEVGATAYWSEYAPAPFKNGSMNPFWQKMPHVMLSKCAEALALRKAFPADLSGIYTTEEMAQAKIEDVTEQNDTQPEVQNAAPALPQPKEEDLRGELTKLMFDFNQDQQTRFTRGLEQNMINLQKASIPQLQLCVAGAKQILGVK